MFLSLQLPIPFFFLLSALLVQVQVFIEYDLSGYNKSALFYL